MTGLWKLLFIWMEKIIAPHKDHPEKVLKFDEIRNILKEMYGIN